jgi:hypothetical protein
MSRFDPPSAAPDPDPLNPYAAPEAELGAPAAAGTDEDLARAEAIRSAYLAHEASVKSLGSLHYLGALFFGIAALGLGAYVMTARVGNNPFSAAMTAAAVLYVVMTGLNVALGNGLRGLRPWARWTDAVLMGLSFLSSLLAMVGWLIAQLYAPLLGGSLGLLFQAYILHILLSSKASVVFSPEYREIIARTPHLRYKTSLLVKFVLAVFVGLITLAIVGTLFTR